MDFMVGFPWETQSGTKTVDFAQNWVSYGKFIFSDATSGTSYGFGCQTI